MYSGGVLFKSLANDNLPLGVSWVSLVPPGMSWGVILNYATIASLPIHYFLSSILSTLNEYWVSASLSNYK